jgi:hypothetical protein
MAGVTLTMEVLYQLSSEGEDPPSVDQDDVRAAAA